MFCSNLAFFSVIVTTAIGGLLERPKNLPCKLDDDNCIKDMTQWILSLTMKGVPEYGVKGSDPIYHDVIDYNLGNIKYKLTKNNIEGTKTCGVKKASMNSTGTSLHMELLCRRTHIDGEYDIKGNLLGVPLNGRGAFNIDTTNYLCSFDTVVSYYEKGGKVYTSHPNYTFKCDLMGELDLNLRTFSTNAADKERHDKTALALIPLAKANAKLFVSLVDRPIHSENFRTVIKSYNKILSRIPASDLIHVNEKVLN